MNDALTGLSSLRLPTVPPLWVPSIFLGRGTKAKQPVPHRAVSHSPALAALPSSSDPAWGFLHCPRGHHREEEEGVKTLKEKVLKDNKRKE